MVAYNSFATISRALLSHSDFLTTLLVVLSTTSSLGALIFAGYNPELKIRCILMTGILALSFASISWNILFYVVLIPTLVNRIGHLVEADRSQKSGHSLPD